MKKLILILAIVLSGMLMQAQTQKQNRDEFETVFERGFNNQSDKCTVNVTWRGSTMYIYFNHKYDGQSSWYTPKSIYQKTIGDASLSKKQMLKNETGIDTVIVVFNWKTDPSTRYKTKIL